MRYYKITAERDSLMEQPREGIAENPWRPETVGRDLKRQFSIFLAVCIKHLYAVCL